MVLETLILFNLVYIRAAEQPTTFHVHGPDERHDLRGLMQPVRISLYTHGLASNRKFERRSPEG